MFLIMKRILKGVWYKYTYTHYAYFFNLQHSLYTMNFALQHLIATAVCTHGPCNQGFIFQSTQPAFYHEF